MDRCYFLVPLGLAGGLLLLLADRPMAASGPLAAYQPVSQPAAAGTTQATVDSANNLKQILLALHNYYDTHGALPLPALTDKAGKPLLSWRVALLPYLEHEGLYREFKLNEPWDSEHNKKLIGRMPKVYATPGTKEEAELGLIGLRATASSWAMVPLGKWIRRCVSQISPTARRTPGWLSWRKRRCPGRSRMNFPTIRRRILRSCLGKSTTAGRSDSVMDPYEHFRSYRMQKSSTDSSRVTVGKSYRLTTTKNEVPPFDDHQE